MFFKSPILYVRVFRNKIEVRDIKSNQEVSHQVASSYSNPRMLISDFVRFEQELKNAVSKILQPSTFNRSFKLIFQPLDEVTETFSQVEMRVFRDSCEHAGASHVYICLKTEKLSNEKIIEGMNSGFRR